MKAQRGKIILLCLCLIFAMLIISGKASKLGTYLYVRCNYTHLEEFAAEVIQTGAKAVCLLDIAVQFAFLGGDTFLLHLASRHAHVDGGQLVNSSLGVAAVVDTLCASGAFKIAV